VLNEMNRSIVAFSQDEEDGKLALLQRIDTLPEGAKPKGSTAEIAVHPTGRYLYASNRGHDSIVAYAINVFTGRLTLIGHSSTIGQTPRHFAITPDGRFLLAAGQKSSSVHSFHICPATGTLRPVFAGSISVPHPVCIVFP
jgi:6-phosphogluconolactonase